MECLRSVFQCMLVRSDRMDIEGNKEDRIPTLCPTKTTEYGSPVGKKNNPYREYGLPSPPRGEKARHPKDAIKSMKKDGFGRYAKQLKTDKSRVLFFLYGRGFFFDAKPKERKKKINKILKDPKALERAVRLVTNDGDKDVYDEKQKEYSTLSQSLVAYFGQEGAFGIPSSSTGATYHFRVQQQGNCFLHAPCIGIGYLMQMKGLDDAAPLDLTQFVRHSFGDEKLFKYLVTDEGGNTVVEFNAMLEGLSSKDADRESFRAKQLTPSLFKRECSLKEYLRNYGPGIIYDFDVHPHFHSSKCTPGEIGYIQFSGKKIWGQSEFIKLSPASEGDVTTNNHLPPTNLERDFSAVDHEEKGDGKNAAALDEGERVDVSLGTSLSHNKTGAAASEEDEAVIETQNPGLCDGKNKIKGQHALLLIGGRRDKNNRLWFLLQNTWENMQLVEVSLNYLVNSDAMIAFAPENYEFAPAEERKNFPLNNSLFADANNLDRAVQMYTGLSPPPLDRVNH